MSKNLHFRKVATVVGALGAALGVNQVKAANPSPTGATANISVTVDGIMEWASAAFADIALTSISSQTATPTGSSSLVIYSNGDVDISADDTAASLLTATGGDTLKTEYSLAYDGNGTTASGGSSVSYTVNNTFLATPSAMTHVSEDGESNVTLGVRASNVTGTLADAGDYTAVQTLTATWGS